MLMHSTGVGQTLKFSDGLEITIVKTEGKRVELALYMPDHIRIERSPAVPQQTQYQQIARSVMSKRQPIGRTLVHSMPPLTGTTPTS
jgi:sRNA-binding carbon storage regulator CsrA